MDREAIKKIIPHRDNMLLLDEVTKEGDTACGKLKITGDEWFLKGHFPGFPVVPGVVICEIMAQCCTLILGDKLIGKTPFYAGLDNVRFKSMVRPGDTIEVSARLNATRGPLYIIDAQSSVGGKLACKGQLTFYLMDAQVQD